MIEPNPDLDALFRALAHPARRSVVKRLSRGPASVSDLADPFDMALPSFLQHLDILSECGMVDSTKQGRVRTYRLTPGPLGRAEGWLAEQRGIWQQRLDQLDDYLLRVRGVDALPPDPEDSDS